VTPEERAALIVDTCNAEPNAACQACITEAITNAIAAEREACARIVDRHAEDHTAVCESCCVVLAAAIRARGGAQ
jgi:hypothetical protein